MGNKSLRLGIRWNFIINKIISMTIRFKAQEDGRKSWVIDEKEIVYESPTNKIHNERLQAILTEHDYLSIGEVSMWVNDADFEAEAQSIIDWWIVTCKLVSNYVDLNPKEETSVQFLATLPTFPL